jgi:hypothetical protein
MKLRTVIGILVASALGFTAMASYAGQGQGGGAGAGASDHAQQADRDRTYDRDRIADRDRMRDRTSLEDPDMKRDQDRDQDRIQMQDPSKIKNEEIYGNELMSNAEREQYRFQLGEAKTQQARKEFQARHEVAMRERARQQDKDLVPPGQGKIYGGELMSVQERNEYREQLRLTKSEAERQQLQVQHREQMKERARALNLEIEEAE